MDFLPEVTLEDDNPEFFAALGRDPTFAQLREPADQAVYAATHFPQQNQERMEVHRRSYPLNDNLLSLLFLVQSDLNENQRERLVSALTNQGYRIETRPCLINLRLQKLVYRILTFGVTSHMKDRHGRRDQRRRRGGSNFLIPDQGEYDRQSRWTLAPRRGYLG